MQSRGFSIPELCPFARLTRSHPKVREVIQRQPKEDLIGVQVPDNKRRSSPINALDQDAVCCNMFAQRFTLIVLEADEDSSMASPSLRQIVDFIEDQLETEQADLTHNGPTLFFIVPILREAESLDIEAQRALSIFDEEDTSRIEIVHILALDRPSQTSRWLNGLSMIAFYFLDVGKLPNAFGARQGQRTLGSGSGSLGQRAPGVSVAVFGEAHLIRGRLERAPERRLRVERVANRLDGFQGEIEFVVFQKVAVLGERRVCNVAKYRLGITQMSDGPVPTRL